MVTILKKIPVLTQSRSQSMPVRGLGCGMPQPNPRTGILWEREAAQSYPVLLITLYLYINSILKIIRKSCVINLLRYIFI